MSRSAATLDLSGKQVAVVGGTNGLGRALARLMAARGAQVIVVGQTFRDEGTPNLSFLQADLSRMSEAKRIGQTLKAETLDLLVMTTGILAAPKRQVTEEGIERDMAVSYLSRLAILREVAPRLARTRPAGAARPRIFVMGFPGAGESGNPDDLNAERPYKAMVQHMNTVAANEAMVLDSAHRYPHARVFGLNPGIVKTGIRANLFGQGSIKHRLAELLIGLFTISPETYAERIVPLLFAPELEERSGAMFNQKAVAILPSEVLTTGRVEAFMSAPASLLSRATGGARNHHAAVRLTPAQ